MAMPPLLRQAMIDWAMGRPHPCLNQNMHMITSGSLNSDQLFLRASKADRCSTLGEGLFWALRALHSAYQ